VQVALSPFIGSADASHGSGLHVAAVKFPAKQLDRPDRLYPILHVGWHVDPDFRLFVQVPLFPFVGLADASHGSGSHVAASSAPVELLDATPDSSPISLQLVGPDNL
jgi:hypothetical protein